MWTNLSIQVTQSQNIMPIVTRLLSGRRCHPIHLLLLLILSYLACTCSIIILSPTTSGLFAIFPCKVHAFFIRNIFHLARAPCFLREGAKFIGYSGRVLGIFDLEKKSAPPLFQAEKKTCPPFFAPQKVSPSFLPTKKLAPLFLGGKKFWPLS